jgi:hypothetical protein
LLIESFYFGKNKIGLDIVGLSMLAFILRLFYAFPSNSLTVLEGCKDYYLIKLN